MTVGHFEVTLMWIENHLIVVGMDQVNWPVWIDFFQWREYVVFHILRCARAVGSEYRETSRLQEMPGQC